MNEKKKLICVIVIFVILLCGGLLAYQKLKDGLNPPVLMTEAPAETEALTETDPETEISSETEQSYQAPDFTFYDDDGNEYALSDFFGKPIVLNFWSSTCPPCRSEMPEFQEVYDEVGEDVQFLMMDCVGIYIGTGVETKKAALDFIEEEGLTLPVYFDSTKNGVNTYGLSSFPTTFFIDKDGNLVTYGMGALDKATLEKGISMITE